MTRLTIGSILLWFLGLGLAGTAAGAPTDEEKCQAAKVDALRKRTFCVQGERRKEILGKTPDTSKCEDRFALSLLKADVVAAKHGASCRWLENGDGTVTDLNSGLQWELKTDDGSVHDKDNSYAWTATPGGTNPTGPVFTEFLGVLNGGRAGQGTTTLTFGCFAGRCDWRLPTIGELRSILDSQAPGCGIDMQPCTTIPGFTAPSHHWSSTSDDWSDAEAWIGCFGGGTVSALIKSDPASVRAVRGEAAP